VADNAQALIVAIYLSDDRPSAAIAEVDKLEQQLAAFLGCEARDVAIPELAAHPVSHAVPL
jgi:hypothetical protein